jgi:methylated-DNA-[protein]-cysteine S-methyltransferase
MSGTKRPPKSNASTDAVDRETYRIATPFHRDLLIASDGTFLVDAQFVTMSRKARQAPRDGVLREASDQARAYFARRLRRFDLPLAFLGTALEIAAWNTVAALAFGEFVSYGDIAAAIGRPLAHRGIARAMGRTPIDLFIPAHRVLGADGRVKGAGPGSLRATLVAFERQQPQRRLTR